MVIRKLGSIGKLARRNSLAGITSLFKDKNNKDDVEEGGVAGSKKLKKKKGDKGTAAEASVSHVTAEVDRDWTGSADMQGLSPAARLARQHTLKSNAEAAARSKAEQEAKAAAAAQDQSVAVPATWEKNTTNRQNSEGFPSSNGVRPSKVNEDGMRVVIEDDDSDSGSEGEQGYPAAQQGNFSIDGWDDDEDWGELQDDDDPTIRQDLEAHADDDEMEPWAIGVRRSVERTRRPTKGILKSESRPPGACCSY